MSIQKYATALTLSILSLFAANAVNAQVVSETKFAKQANVKVFVTTYIGDADVVVFKTPFIKNAYGNKGQWYITTASGEANKTICYVPSKEVADIVVMFTPDSKQAGWKNKKKKHFLD